MAPRPDTFGCSTPEKPARKIESVSAAMQYSLGAWMIARSACSTMWVYITQAQQKILSFSTPRLSS